jgi:hypothetical protein
MVGGRLILAANGGLRSATGVIPRRSPTKTRSIFDAQEEEYLWTGASQSGTCDRRIMHCVSVATS